MRGNEDSVMLSKESTTSLRLPKPYEAEALEQSHSEHLPGLAFAVSY